MKTDFETLKALANYTINHLKEDGLIEFNLAHRLDLIDSMATEYGVSFATDEDIQEQAIEEVEEKMGHDNVPDDITESEIFNHAKKEIIKSFNGENISGLYLVESLHQIGKRMTTYLLNSDLIEDVFATDDDLHSFFVNRLRQFNIRRG